MGRPVGPPRGCRERSAPRPQSRCGQTLGASGFRGQENGPTRVSPQSQAHETRGRGGRIWRRTELREAAKPLHEKTRACQNAHEIGLGERQRFQQPSGDVERGGDVARSRDSTATEGPGGLRSPVKWGAAAWDCGAQMLHIRASQLAS